MDNKLIKQLGEVGTNAAMRGASEYLQGKKYDADLLGARLREHCQTALPVALADAKEALACNMGQVAVATFTATMALAGISAAKEAEL